jgi:hypothetical protein
LVGMLARPPKQRNKFTPEIHCLTLLCGDRCSSVTGYKGGGAL